MRIRTYLGLLLALGAIFLASYLTHQNQQLIHEPFRLATETTVPLWTVLLGVFLLGLLPTMTVLLVGSVRRDLALRDERRKSREAESIQASFRRAVDYQADGQWARAASELEVVLAARPKDFSPLLRYGEVLRRMGRLERALEVHQRASVQYPTSAALLYQLAEDYEARGEGEVAREIRNRLLRDFPSFGLSVLRRRRNAALGARQFAKASELERQIQTLAPAEAPAAPEGAAPAAPGAEEAGREEARLEDGVRLGLEYERGVAQLEGEEVEAAMATFRGLLEREPRFIPAAIMLGEAQLVAEDEPAAIETWLAGYRRTGSPVFLQRIEDHFIEGEEPRRAIETLRRLIAEGGRDLLPRFFLGRLYYRLEMHDEALKVLEALAERIGTSPTYYYVLGRLRERRGELLAAVDCYATCARQLGLAQAEYRCKVCRAMQSDWRDRCDACGSWSSIEMDFEEENVSAEALGVAEAAVWKGPQGWDLADLDEPKATPPKA